MAFPAEKYNYIIARREDNHKPFKVIALSTYCGKAVRGIAKCDPRDEFDEHTGMRLAAARCNMKVAEKRYKRAHAQYLEAREAANNAITLLEDKGDYLKHAGDEYRAAQSELAAIESSL